MIAILTMICATSALSLGFLYMATKDKIAGETKKVIEESLVKVIPDAHPQGFEKVETKTKDGDFVYYKAYDKPLNSEEKKLVGFATTGKSKGYSSEIIVMVGIDSELKKFKGVKVLSQQETPGLGTQCQEEKVDKKLWAPTADPGKPKCWTDQFEGKEIEGLKIVKEDNNKDIVAITGATITSKAVLNAATNDAIKKLKEVLSGDSN